MPATAFDHHWRRRAAVWLTGLLAVLLVWLASGTRPWQGVDNKMFDLFTSLSAPGKSDLPLVILAIDEPTFQQLQVQWPFPRGLHAQVLERLRADGARAVGFDVVFAEPSNPQDDDAFAQAIKYSPPIVLGAARELTESGNASLWTEVQPLAQFLSAGALAGQLRVMPDDDFVVRQREPGPDTFAARLAESLTSPVGKAKSLEKPDLMAYVGPRGTFDTRSYYQALEPGLLPEGFFKDKIVLIGRTVRTASELKGTQIDMFNSPFSLADGSDRLFPGVEIQATLLDNLVSDGGIRSLDRSWQLLLVLALISLLTLTEQRAHPGAIASLVVLLSGVVAVTSYGLFAGHHLWLSPLFPMLAVLAFYAATLVQHVLAARKRALQTRQMFSQYVPQEVVARLMENPELLRLGGEARELTLMFTDLANFTAMSERLTPEATVEVLTDYFNAMTQVIHHYGGTVDKFIGDAVMAFWGAPLDDPRHAEHAVRAAIDMQASMQALTHQLVARGLPSISMRIGVHTGRVVVGNVGSRSRFSYTAIGDAVNLAARLEGANKAFGTGVLVSGDTAANLPSDLTLRLLDTVIVKGKSEPIKVFTPCNDANLCGLSLRALALFEARQWDESAAVLTQVLAHVPTDLAALRLLRRIDEARSSALAPDWCSALALDKL